MSDQDTNAVRINVNGEGLVLLVMPEHAGRGSGPQAVERVTRALGLLEAVEALRADESASKRDVLLKAMLLEGIDPLPGETVAQARRLATHRATLLASGAYTVAALREVRGDASASATRTWLARRRAAGQLFTVTHEGSTLVPSILLDETASPRPAVASVLRALAPSALGGWATWTWFVSGSSWLGGERPVDLLDTDPTRVTKAADRFAANVA